MIKKALFILLLPLQATALSTSAFFASGSLWNKYFFDLSDPLPRVLFSTFVFVIPSWMNFATGIISFIVPYHHGLKIQNQLSSIVLFPMMFYSWSSFVESSSKGWFYLSITYATLLLYMIWSMRIIKSSKNHS